ncbi:hypothetical protein MACK_003175 [Theileria orientalis]|uniref:Uncharacterized protein n=1 Tax=Theileria orientalis TaxID=68886 RepID=A0A976XJ06_THEOR|nr:hypothetical protein MACK_003175 [Theileria orientalis]
MEPLEQLKGHDSFRYLGVLVSVTMTTGDILKGELYCLDQKGQTLVLKSELGDDSFSFHVLRLSSIIKFEVLGRLNDSIYDIPRLTYEDLAHFKPVINRTDDNHTKRTH